MKMAPPKSYQTWSIENVQIYLLSNTLKLVYDKFDYEYKSSIIQIEIQSISSESIKDDQLPIYNKRHKE